MTYFLLDASSLAKRYVPEAGMPLVHHLFDEVGPSRLGCILIGALETLSVIVRARNGGRISRSAAEGALVSFTWEILCGPISRLYPAESTLLAAGDLIERHNINSTDAVLLRMALNLQATMRQNGNELVLVASDGRLLRAADQEAIPAFDPETGDLPSLRRLAGRP